MINALRDLRQGLYAENIVFEKRLWVTLDA